MTGRKVGPVVRRGRVSPLTGHSPNQLRARVLMGALHGDRTIPELCVDLFGEDRLPHQRDALDRVAQLAKREGLLINEDPNHRPPHPAKVRTTAAGVEWLRQWTDGGFDGQ